MQEMASYKYADSNCCCLTGGTCPFLSLSAGGDILLTKFGFILKPHINVFAAHVMVKYFRRDVKLLFKSVLSHIEWRGAWLAIKALLRTQVL